MSAPGQLTGLPMPVFAAFGWAGEENAINFALSQLEAFIHELHPALSREARSEFPHFGMDRATQTIFIAAKREAEEGPYIAFLARPTTLEMRFSVTDRAVINRGLRAAEKNPADWHRYLRGLGENWSIHLQQNLVDEESGGESFYQDIYKGSVLELDEETCQNVTGRAAFLNSEAKWVTPVYISHRIPSEQAAGMGRDLATYLADEIDRLMSILFLFTHSNTTTRKEKKKAAARAKTVEAAPEAPAAPARDSHRSFTYIAELKPLHIRKGFINLTPRHWPFFADSARSETRQVTVIFEGRSDNNSAVWRLQPNEMARIVLGEKPHIWLEKNFSPESTIQVHASRSRDDEIQIELSNPE